MSALLFRRRRASTQSSTKSSSGSPTAPTASSGATEPRPSSDFANDARSRQSPWHALASAVHVTQPARDIKRPQQRSRSGTTRTESGETHASSDSPSRAESHGWRSPDSAATSATSFSRRTSDASDTMPPAACPLTEAAPDTDGDGDGDAQAEETALDDTDSFHSMEADSSTQPEATSANPQTRAASGKLRAPGPSSALLLTSAMLTDSSASNASRPSLLSLHDGVPVYSSSALEMTASRAQSPPPIQVRRLTNNSLTLPNFPRASPPMQPVPLPQSEPGADPSSARPEASSTERRIRTLPRLLSNDAYSMPMSGRSGESGPDTVAEADEGETESDTELETSETQDSDEDGDDDDDSDEVRSGDDSNVQPSDLIRIDDVRVTPVSTPGRHMDAGPRTRVPPSWVTFGGVTPTPGPSRPATRYTGDSSAPTESYFDIRRDPSSTASPRTPGQPLMTPLVPQSLSNVARGKRPQHQDELEGFQTGEQQNQSRMLTPGTMERALQSSHYRRRSQSAVALLSPSMLDEDGQPVGTAEAPGLDAVWRQSNQPATPLADFLKPPPTPAVVHPSPTPSTPKSPIVGGHVLSRRRSMYELQTTPPAYHAVYDRPGVKQVVYPREEEGKEQLPEYTCAIHLEGYMPRKMEFSAPSVQAKDRSWKRVYMVLHGTSVKFYKYDLKTHPMAGEEDWSSLTTEMAGKDGPPPLHFHPGEYGVEEGTTTHHKFPTSIGDARAKAKSKIVQATTSSDANALLRHYSLQNAESGLAADYLKRKHVVRVRAEGEQFLLQTNGDRGTIDLIEVLQAATNVSLDLDCRPLPKFITLPRRRRRRRRPAETTNAASGQGAAGTTASGTGEQQGQSASAARRDEDPTDRMGDMLAEEQQAYAAASGASAV